MKVVLLADVKKIGRKYDVATVSDGYALNFLIPQKKAVVADAGKIKWAEVQKKNNVSTLEIQANLLAKSVDVLSAAVVTIVQKVNAKGHLFAGLHKENIATELQKQTGLAIDPELIVLEKNIKEVGEHTIPVESGEVKTSFKLVVQAE